MSRRVYTVRRHGDVVTFKCGRYVESFDVSVLGPVTVWERIRWAAVTCGISLNEATLQELLEEALGLREEV